MSFQVTSGTQPNKVGLDTKVYFLGREPDTRLMVWPALGFNCLHWQVERGSRTLDLLYVDPDQYTVGRPTRSGIPVLFPFPNRIRDGKFVWDGKTYQLPINDGNKKNNIHGFACHYPWRVIDQGSNTSECWITGEFHCSKDAQAELVHWPTDHCIRLTYRLSASSLRIEAEVINPDTRPMPFGLGYHPYFRIPFVKGESCDQCNVQVSANRYWELEDNLPTGNQPPVDARRDLNNPRNFKDLLVDDVLCGLPNSGISPNDLYRAGEITSTGGYTLRMLCSPEFREQVVFTPPHREAVCIEPYTCVTDAINLQQKGVDAGLMVLNPGDTWKGVVQLDLLSPLQEAL